MKATIGVLVLLALVAVQAEDSLVDSTGMRIAMKLYEDCSKAEGFSPCLKKKAITFLDRLGRMDHIALAEGVIINKAANTTPQDKPMTEEQLETTLPRAADAKDEALSSMLMDKVTSFLGSRSIEVTLPKLSEVGLVEEGRKKSGGGGGGMKGMMGGMMMGVAAKMAALIPIAIAGLFLLAGKALITAKIALLISGIIAIKKLFASKGGGGGGHGGGWQSGGGGWQSSGGGGGWDKRSLDESHKVAYKAYAPK